MSKSVGGIHRLSSDANVSITEKRAMLDEPSKQGDSS